MRAVRLGPRGRIREPLAAVQRGAVAVPGSGAFDRAGVRAVSFGRQTMSLGAAGPLNIDLDALRVRRPDSEADAALHDVRAEVELPGRSPLPQPLPRARGRGLGGGGYFKRLLCRPL